MWRMVWLSYSTFPSHMPPYPVTSGVPERNRFTWQIPPHPPTHFQTPVLSLRTRVSKSWRIHSVLTKELDRRRLKSGPQPTVSGQGELRNWGKKTQVKIEAVDEKTTRLPQVSRPSVWRRNTSGRRRRQQPGKDSGPLLASFVSASSGGGNVTTQCTNFSHDTRQLYLLMWWQKGWINTWKCD